MAQEITLSLFERNAKIQNKKGLRRTFSSIPAKYNEYIVTPPLGATEKFVIEATLDKEYVTSFIEFLKEKDFTILGSANYYFLEKVINDYELKKEMFQNQKEAIAAVTKDVELMKENKEDYKEVEEDDAKFYFLPYNKDIDTLFEFVGVYKDQLIEFARKYDITIMMRPIAYCNQLEGFFGFNFLDAEKEDEDVVVDYAATLSVVTDFSKSYSVYASGLILTGIGENAEELDAMNTHFVAENIKYTKE